MEIRYIAEFVALAKTCNFLETSNRIFVSQSSLTRHIQGLEDELGVPLFDRSGKKIKLSVYGELFLPYAIKLIDIHKECKNAIDIYSQSHDEVIVLGCIPSVQEYPEVYSKIIEYSKSHFNVSLIEADSFELMNMLHNGEIDFAVVRTSDKMDVGEGVIEFDEDPVVAVVPKDHPFADKKAIKLIDLANERLCLLGTNAMLSRLCKTACSEAGCEPKISFMSYHCDSIMQKVKDGFGVGMLTERTTRKLVDDDVRIIHFEPELITKICLVYNKNQRLNMAGVYFLNMMTSS